MNRAIALPLVTGPSYTSANMPPITAIGDEALIPATSLNTNSAGQLGATAQASVESVYMIKVDIMMVFLPYASLRGPNNRGPNT